ncbi:hypothetical protein T4D_13189 [Trichinella pseudospiralis]|uniref:Uncharacterized protein n=1 Tax=Trichinella pseudospiralis TaxID=6337 RepID=A0A0V1FEL7_TRIPS|nr:hypothetical protein T4D_8989 [Trichinella pseudospiralis]KRY89855.1 hypothetical protein T4D_13189 [Trichinella pseudospiralis]
MIAYDAGPKEGTNSVVQIVEPRVNYTIHWNLIIVIDEENPKTALKILPIETIPIIKSVHII